MIIRLMDDAQYEVDDGVLPELDGLDEQALAAMQRDDPEALRTALEQMADIVRERGRRLDDASLAPSDLMLPAADLSLEEARRVMNLDEGLIPNIAAP